MCYDVKFLTQKKLKYAKRRGGEAEEIKVLEDKLIKLSHNVEPRYCVSGFQHPGLLVFTNKDDMKPELFSWGLVPLWIKNQESALQIQNKTINARAESIFEKASFKYSAGIRHCLVMVDGFYEHHYLHNKAYPYYVYHPNEEPMVLAGLWSVWETEEKDTFHSVTIVTTKAKGIMTDIHNNPKLKESRMPLILSKEKEKDWLFHVRSPEDLSDFLKENQVCNLEAHPVYFIRGNKSLGNVPSASDAFSYPELSSNTLL